MTEDMKVFVMAIAKANGHPDPEGYAEDVASHLQPSAPAAPTAPSGDNPSQTGG